MPDAKQVHAVLIVVGLMLASASPACRTPPRESPDDADRSRMLSLLMPTRIEIVRPFTRVRSFDRDAVPDGIELLLRAVNALDNPGLMIVGRLRVELYEFVNASADPRGRRLDYWDIDLSTVERQKAYWNQLTQMYEFRLGVDSAVLPRAKSFVLAVSYRTPLGEQLTDQFVLEYGGPGVALDVERFSR